MANGLVFYEWHVKPLLAACKDEMVRLLDRADTTVLGVTPYNEPENRGMKYMMGQQTPNALLDMPVSDFHVYNPERQWTATPEDQKADPVGFMKEFAKKYAWVGFAPSPTLIVGDHKHSRMIDELLVPTVEFADEVDLQFQVKAITPKIYESLVKEACDKVRGPAIYAQLSASRASVEQNMRCFELVRDEVDGFWFVLDTKDYLQVSIGVVKALAAKL